MFGNLKVGTRLALGFGAITLLLLVISVTSILRLATVHQASAVIMDDLYPKVSVADDITKASLNDGRYVRNMLLSTTEDDTDKAWQMATATRATIGDDMKKL